MGPDHPSRLGKGPPGVQVGDTHILFEDYAEHRQYAAGWNDCLRAVRDALDGKSEAKARAFRGE